MRLGAAFLVLAAGAAAAAGTAAGVPARLALGWTALSFGIVAAAYLGLGPRAFMKRGDGRLAPASYLLLAPYHLVNGALLLLAAALDRRPPCVRVVPGLYLGGRRTFLDPVPADWISFAAVLDLAAELPEHPALRGPGYRSLPVLDTRAPSRGQLLEGVRHLLSGRAEGPVHVHCALGHGRSAALAAAYLLAVGAAADPRAAEDMLRQARPGVKLSADQRRALQAAAPSLLEMAARPGASKEP